MDERLDSVRFGSGGTMDRQINGRIITSTANQQVKQIIQLKNKAAKRAEQGVFLAEGIRLCRELPSGWIERMYVSEPFLQKEENLQSLHRFLKEGIGYEVVSDAVYARLSDTKTPQGILCVARRPSYVLADLMQADQTHLLILEGIQDPGNMGTIVRTAEGAGVTGIIMDAGCVDLFAPKTVRATMGSICRVPFIRTNSLADTIQEVKRQGIRIFAAHLSGRNDYDELDYTKGTAFLIGSEASGLKEETARQADVYLKIPMEGRLESLNAAMAAGILMYETARQRRKRSKG